MTINPAKILDIQTPPDDFVLRISVDDKWHGIAKSYHVFTNESLVIFYQQEQHKFRKDKTSRQQLVAPKSSIKWLYETIENTYGLNNSHQQSAKLGTKEEFDSESILLNRAVSIDGEGIPGFILNNFSRTQYGWNDDDGITQDLSFPDDFLKNSSFLNDLKSLNI